MNYPIIFETIRQTALSPVNFVLPGILLIVAIATLVKKKYKIAIGSFVATIGIGIMSFFGIQEASNLDPIKIYENRIVISSQDILYDEVANHMVSVTFKSKGDPIKGGFEEKTLIIKKKDGEVIKVDGMEYDVEKIDNELKNLIK